MRIRILEDSHGFYLVDSTDDIMSCRIVFTKEMIESHAQRLYPFADEWKRKLNHFDESGEIPFDYHRLGYEEEVSDDGDVVQTMRWARSGSYRWVEK